MGVVSPSFSEAASKSFRRVLSLLFLLLFPFFSPLFAIESKDVNRLIEVAESRKLHLDPVWLRLLHYRGEAGDFSSEADGPAFFLSGMEGKSDPLLELVATLRGFFIGEEEMRERSRILVPDLVASGVDIDPNVHPACMFPARREWLSEKLKDINISIPVPECPNLEIFQKDIQVRSLSIVFASYFMREPSSMFGHTLLKLNSDDTDRKSKLLDYAVNYAANTGSVDPFSYVILGMTGGFPGSFSLMPYHMKVQEYNDTESRDLWEYELNLDSQQLRRAVLHLWELSSTHFDYFFMDENCAYHLLGVVEVARPELDLKSGFHAWVIPGETIKELLKHEGLVRRRIYRPSHLSRIESALEGLTDEEEEFFLDLLEGDLSPEDPGFQNLEESSRVRSMDMALSVLRYHKETGNFGAEEQGIYRRLLLARTTLPPGELEGDISPRSHPVEEGHGVHRFGLGAGVHSGTRFADLTFRPFLHDLVGRHDGYANRAELLYLDGEIRFYEGEKAPWVDHLDIIRLTGLAPVNMLTSPVSLVIAAGFRSYDIPAEKIRLTNEEEFFYTTALKRASSGENPLYGILLADQTGGKTDSMRTLGRASFDFFWMDFCEGSKPSLCGGDARTFAYESFFRPEKEELFLEEETVRSSYFFGEAFPGKTLEIGPSRLGLQVSLLAGAQVRYDLFYNYRSTLLPGIRSVFYWDARVFRLKLEGSLYSDHGEALPEATLLLGVALAKDHELRLEGRAERRTSQVSLAYTYYY